MSIKIGLTGWGDHPALYSQSRNKHKLIEYSSHFPTVEIDSSFYAIQDKQRYQKWTEQTPDSFSFVIKAYQTLTGHDRQNITNREMKLIMEQFKQSFEPVVEANKLNMVLFQFPPWFGLTKQNIIKLQKLREWAGDLPVALEFRNRTWFEEYRDNTMDFLREEDWIHVICDEPQAGTGSIPIVLETSNNNQALIRFHGRNVHGWNNHGQENWREVRFLYRYNEKELLEWVERIQILKKQVDHITILFNNNSGGDAYDNAKQLINLLDIRYEDLHPKQMDIFDELF
ncbi:Uncharacterized conserved protein YecE, DUF72 family [Gracilibacillus ureilyticus]|uniref:Uncharacterized conserved protein YecE, DUF72 family n=1 Tax=Gracilibacillus ureilyticus TaxID=531814 RepID=A0A1H9LL42_9BACI|nr:DUF72 domain-containing protein [Gracilibacillus ureilyticus]SER11959.1 Uncharacterized conserved protein YecE, DUF72 family [Gracilibacillus ureilyticus]